jgi:hypothetical protein
LILKIEHDRIPCKIFQEVSIVKQKSWLIFMVVLVLSVISIGCSSVPTPSGEKGKLEDILNALPAIDDPVSGKKVKFEFDRNVWYQKADGKNFLAGTFESEGDILTLTQTHIYSDEQKPGIGGDIGWIETSGPEITLEYKAGPPASLSVK